MGLGVGPGVLVGLCLGRSIELPVALLAVLKAGGAYVPLDPTHPTDRITAILADSGAALLLVNEGFAAPAGTNVIDLGAEHGPISRQSLKNPAPTAAADDLAYVIYTSGSTGKPKGVAVSHRALLNLLEGMRERPGLDGTDTLLAVTTVSFDIATLELLLPLTVGARTALAGPEAASDGTRLAEELFRSQATVLQATPTTWRILIDSGWRGQSNLKMLCGGEPLPRDLADALLSRGGSLWNMYGPTETTIWSAAGRIAAGEGAPPIGPPIANTQLYVLDEDLRPVAIGVRGDVFIGGDGLARGYWNLPDLTERSFIPDPFRHEPGARLYRTGDLGRFRPDGRIELLGRGDRQVKLRGYRIELGEVEAALASHPAVREAAAVVREDSPGVKRLVGYVVPKGEGNGSAAEAAWQAEMSAQWQAQYGSAIREGETQGAPELDPSLNLYGWAGLGNVKEELDAWLAPIAEEIRSWSPRRVLEIGCGTGLLLDRLAPACLHYTGTDLSPEALESLRGRLIASELPPGRVELLCRMADDFRGIEAGSFDTVIVNSVVEYLPSVESLLRVLDGAVRAAGRGGRVYIGDVPSLPMWEVFHATAQFDHAPDALPAAQVRERVRHAVSRGSRLLVDPDLFRALKHRFPQLERVEVRLSRGRFSSEASRLHADTYYDAILHLEGAGAGEIPARRARLGRRAANTSGTRGSALGGNGGGPPSESPDHATRGQGEDPRAARGGRRPRDGRRSAPAAPETPRASTWPSCAISPIASTTRSTGSGPIRGATDAAIFSSAALPGKSGVRISTGLSRDVARPKPWSEYANSPALSALARRVVPEIRTLLKQVLPAYMVPAMVEVLDALPVTGNGKVDYRALPAPRGLHLLAEETFMAPRTEAGKDPRRDLGGGPAPGSGRNPRRRLRARRRLADDLPDHDAGESGRFRPDTPPSLSAPHHPGADGGSGPREEPERGARARPPRGGLPRRAPRQPGEPASGRGRRRDPGIAIRMQSPALSPALPETQPLPPLDGAGDVFVFPASFGQKGLWLVDQFNPGSTAYSLPILLRVAGILDPVVLEKALNEIVRRHEILRTTLSRRHGELVQVISPAERLTLALADLSPLPEAEREARAFEQAREESRRSFDLGQGPLFRAALWRLSHGDHLFLLNMHHVVADWWSFAVLYRELTELYEAFEHGRESPLPDLALQYADFAQWQRERMQGQDLEGHLAFWKAALAGAPPVLDLRTDRPRAPRQTFPGASESELLSRDLTARIRELSRREGVTPYMTLLSAFFALLHRHTGQTDMVVGSPIANRTRVELESLIGLLMNTLVLRADLSGNPTFRQLLARVGRVCVDAYAHQDLPFERLLEELKPERTLSHSPLFQVLMTLQSAPAAPPRLAGLDVTALPVAAETSKFDLSAYFEDRGEEIWASFQYNTDLFEASTVRWMLGHLRTLLEGAVANPDLPLSRLPVLTEAERLQIAVENHRVAPTNTFVEFRKEDVEQSITERFEQQARRHPERTAVRTGAHSWTYERLAREADRAARAVLELAGSGPQRVALLFDQDAPMIAAILGSLKAGKTYVPLDPSYPTERLAYMLEDCGATVILTNDRNLPLAASLGEGRCAVASLDRRRPASPVAAPPLRIGPETVAYVLYTSGSTGRPKGVVQNHRNVLHFIRAYTNRLHIRTEERLSLLSSYSFDAAVMDIFGALLNGATLCLWDFKTRGVAGLSEWLAKEEITILHAVPTVFRAFAGSLKESQKFPKVRLVVLGGEEVHRGDVELHRRHFSRECLMVNGLGPTESTVTLQYFLDHETEIPRGTVPVGYPVDDTEILLVDAQGEASEIRGEIGIRSPHVALGYWGKLEMTQAAFLPDPEGGTRRIYLTGDLGRRLPGGAIEFVGRKDSRVKVRGHRIELGEIEETLAKHPSVREAVVVVREEALGGQRLIAYVVGDSKEHPSVSQLRAFLEGKLPDFMVPSLFVWLDSFPLTASGKVNRGALPAPNHEPPVTERASVGPRTVLESHLVRIWERILDVKPVGVTDNFFDLGGHSLLAVHLLTQVEKATGRTLPLSAFFQAQTVAEMAARLEENRAPASWSSLVAIQPGGSRPPLYCVHAQGSEALEYRVFAQYLGPDQPLYGLSPRGLDGRLPPDDRVEDMAAHYVAEIREAQPEGPYYLGGWSFGGVIAFEMARQLQAAGQAVGLLSLFDTYSRVPVRSTRPTRLRFIWQRLQFHVGALSRLEPAGRSRYLSRKGTSALAWSRWQLRGLYPSLVASVRRSVPTAYDRVRAANWRAAQTYVPKPYEGCLTLFRATGMGLASSDDPYLGWGDVPGVDIEVIEIPGVHRSILREEEDIRTLVERLRGRLRLAQEAGGSRPGSGFSR